MARGAIVAATLATATGPLPARGGTAAVFSPGGVAWDDDGTIVFAGDAERVPWEPVSGDVGEGTIVPGFVDCHAHLPFVGWRADEYEARLAGVSYRDLHGREGGIRQLRLARRLAEACPQTCVVTLLACHAVPEGWSRADWVTAACDELIPAAASERLADAVDVYV